MNSLENNNQDKEVLRKLQELQTKFNKDDEKKGVMKKLIDNFKELEVSAPETDPKKIIKDLIPAILEILCWI
ncbi:hypothetical protein [Clostridium sp. Marseille-Q2269]|uniref:hypothetical protein n=1 Tax=Clostridium sp. Marseille-Q2269 TaxID=2942205 RepID=UPI0020738105|nr:hypothetical protein [Clostridium sp. Marseille-Q2269]